MHALMRAEQSGSSGDRGVMLLTPDDVFDRRPTPLWHLPDPKVATAKIAQILIDVMLGQRPVSQLNAVTNAAVRAEVLRAVAALSPGSGVPRARLRVASVRVTTPGPTIVEASAVVRGTQRSRAMALRLEGLDGRWLCTALRVG